MINMKDFHMKALAVYLFIILSAALLFPQSATIDTGLYLVAPNDDCSGRTEYHRMVDGQDTLCLEVQPVITVHDLASCGADSAVLDGKEAFVLNIRLKKSIVSKFTAFTKQHVGRKLALVIDEQVVMAPMIRDPITSGQLTVSGETGAIIRGWERQLKQEMGTR